MGKHKKYNELGADFLSLVRYAFPANKFFPPVLTPSQYLFRPNLIREVLQNQGKGKKIFLFEAQGGQGKTTLAAQYLQDSQNNFAWYRLGPEDGDPVHFLTAILVSLKKARPTFYSPLLEELVVSGELDARDLTRLATNLLADLVKDLTGDFFIVLDDIHLLEESEYSLKLLDFLLDSSPPNLRFILLSRRPVGLQSRHLRYTNEVLRLGNRDLSLSEDETETLMTDILQLKFQKDAIGEIHRISNGWVLGVVMAGHTLSLNENHPKTLNDVKKSFVQRDILDFFRHEVFALIPGDCRNSLMKLSMLEEVHEDLAEKITGDNEIGAKLSGLLEGNYFVMQRDHDDHIYRFHHLFKDFMRIKASEVFSAKEKAEIYNTAIAHSLAGKRFAEALRYCLIAEHYVCMEQILKAEGIGFLATNRGATLLAILTAVPNTIQFSHGWIALFIGCALSELAPEKCCEYLEQARSIFVETREEVGELLAQSQLIFYYWVVAATLKTGSCLLPRTVELYQRVESQLPNYAKVFVAKNIAAGYCYFNCDMVTAHQYSSVARTLSKKLQRKGLEASVILVQSYENFLLGRRKLNRIELEEAYSLLHDPQVASVYKMALGTMHIDDLQLHGDFENYFIQKEQLLSMIDKETLSQTIVGPFLYVWDIGILVAQGKFNDALAKMDEGVRSGPVAQTSHMMSQFLHWKAYILAHLGEPEAALKAARKSLLLREQAGGPFYEILNGILLGTVFGRVGMQGQAENMLSKALSEAKKYRINYLRAACLLHRAHVYTLANKMEEAGRDIEEGLRCMRENDYGYVLGLTPEKLENVLTLAVQHNIEVEYACDIARKRLGKTFVKGGKSIPLLTIRLLGGFELEFGGQILLAADDMTPLQCRLLALLATSNNMKMRQELIQLAFWPESPPEKSRSNFDSLLSRLRKSLRSALGQHPVTDYLVLQHGILCLHNCVLDVNIFREAAAKGLRHAKENEWWQAANCFHAMVNICRGGSIDADVIADDQVHDSTREIQRLIIEVASVWGKHLGSASREDQALVVLQKGLNIDPIEPNLVKMSYHLYRGRGDLVKAKTLLKEYEQNLIAENFDVSERQLMLNEVVAAGPSSMSMQ
ncbi:MAG: hypothetical protein KJ555_02240 [Proteobacteria bacterium]|nr:hypothetical protein [Pseudomonadota bacterium]